MINLLFFNKGSLNYSSANGVNTCMLALLNELSTLDSVSLSIFTTSNKKEYPLYSSLDRGNFYVNRYKYFALLLPRLVREISNSDMVHLSNLFSYENIIISLVCILLKRKFCITTWASCLPDRRAIKSKKKLLFDLLIQRFCINKAKSLIVCCDREFYSAKKFYQGVQIRVVNNFCADMNASDILLKTPEKNSVITVGYLGRFAREKNLINILHWINSYNISNSLYNVKFLFSGPLDTEYADKFKHELQSLSMPNVIVTDAINLDQKVSWFNSVDILMLQSLSDASPLVATEALRQGRAVVCSTDSGIDSFESSCIFYNNNTESQFINSLNQALEKYLENPILMQRESRNLFLKHFSTKANVQKLLHLYME